MLIVNIKKCHLVIDSFTEKVHMQTLRHLELYEFLDLLQK